MKFLLHFLDTAVDFAGVAREVLTDFLDQSPGEHVGGGTLDTDRVDDLNCVSTKIGLILEIGGSQLRRCSLQSHDICQS